NTDGDATFEVKEHEFKGRKHESKIHISPSRSAQKKKHDDKTKREAKGKSHVESSTGYGNLSANFEDFSDNSINEVNAADTSVPAVGRIFTNSTNIFTLEDITYFDDDEDVGTEADFTNLETTITVNDVTRLQALVDRKKVIITEVTIREALRLDDAESIYCLPNEEIFTKLERMGYEKPSTKLTFYKAFFSSQWKFLIHTILQCMSAKRTAWNDFSSSMALAVICLSTGRKFNFSKYIFDSLVRNVDSSSKFYMYPRFLQLMIRAQVGDLSSHITKYSSRGLTQKVFTNMRRVGKGFSGVETPLFEGMIMAQQIGEGATEVNVNDVPAVGVANEDADDVNVADAKPSIPSPPPTTQSPPPPQEQEQPSTSQVLPTPPPSSIAQALEITKLKQMAKKLEMRNKLKVSKLRRLKKVGTAKRVETSDDTVMDDVSKQGGITELINADKDVSLENVENKDDADVQGRLAESQAQIYQIVLEHADKTITAVATAAAPTLTTAPSAARRKKEVVIRDPEETSTPSIIIHYKLKSKDKVKGIMVHEPKPLKKKTQIEHDKAYVRELEAKLNKNIDWDEKVPNDDDDDVYTEATSLALNVPVASVHNSTDPGPSRQTKQALVHNSSDPAPTRLEMASVQNSTDPGPTCQTKASVQISSDPAPECQTMAL
nr:hypothetical protein [Tanacetum cinerariifolium]